VRRRHGGGCSEQLAAPACSLCVLNVFAVREKKKKRRKEKGEEKAKGRKRKGKNMEIFLKLENF
jgi:hypothetical protein